MRAAGETPEQRRTIAELRADVRSFDAFGFAHVKARGGRMHKIHRDGRIFDFDRETWLRPEWAAAR